MQDQDQSSVIDTGAWLHQQLDAQRRAGGPISLTVRRLQSEGDFSHPLKYNVGDEVYVKIGNEVVKTTYVDLAAEYARLVKQGVKEERIFKTAHFQVRQATAREEISTNQDGTSNTAEPGDLIIQNPGDSSPYVYGNKKDSIEQRNEKFHQRYEQVIGKAGEYRLKDDPQNYIKGVKADRAVTFMTSWNETMSVKAGGYLTDLGYSIAPSSIAADYRVVQDSTKVEEPAPELFYAS